jgi:hypothetical protein
MLSVIVILLKEILSKWFQLVKRFEHSTGREFVIRLENVIDMAQDWNGDESSRISPCH